MSPLITLSPSSTPPSSPPTNGCHLSQYNLLLCYYHFAPSIPFAAAATVLFFVVGVFAAFFTLRYGGGIMMKILVASCFAESIGYGLRIVATENITLINYICTTLFILITPIFIALVDYLVIGHIMVRVGKSIKVLCVTHKPERVARFFVASDVVCFLLQATGGSMLAVDDVNTQNLGKAIVVASLVIQLTFFTAFSYITWIVNFDEEFLCKRVPALEQVFLCVWSTIALLYVRNIYRLIEFSSGWTSYVSVNEWCFIAFETMPMLLTLIIFTALHYGRLMEFNSASEATWIAQIEQARVDRSGNKTANTSEQSADMARPGAEV